MRIYIFNLEGMTIATCSEDKLRDTCEYIYRNNENWEDIIVNVIDKEDIDLFVCDYDTTEPLHTYYMTPFNDYENLGLCLYGLGGTPDITFDENPIQYYEEVDR